MIIRELFKEYNAALTKEAERCMNNCVKQGDKYRYTLVDGDTPIVLDVSSPFGMDGDLEFYRRLINSALQIEIGG